MRPGKYDPDCTEGITRVEDLPSPVTERRSRNYRRRACPRCRRGCYRDNRGRRVSAPAQADATFLAPDGRTLLRAGTRQELKLLDLVTGAEVTLMGQTGSAKLVSFSEDGKLLATLHYGGALRVWDVGERKEKNWRLSLDDATRIALSPAGSVLATAQGTGVVLRDAGSGEEQARLPGRGGVYRLTFAPREEMKLLVAQDTQEVVLWDLGTPKRRATLPADLNSRPSFAPDEETLLIGRTTADTVQWQLWDVKTGKVRVALPEPGLPGASAAFSPNSRTLALLNASGDAVSLWDVRSGRQRATCPLYRTGAVALAFTPDGERLAVVFSDGVLHVWPRTLLEQTTSVGRPGAAVSSLSFDHRGKEVAVLTEKAVDWWDLAENSRRGAFPLPRGTTPCAVCPGASRRVAVADGDGVLKLLDPDAKKEWSCGRVSTNGRLVFNSDGKLLAAAAADGTVKVWDATTEKEVTALRGAGGSVRALVFSGDGKWLASAGESGVSLWEFGAVKDATSFKTTDVTCLALSSDGKLLITGHADRSVRLWDVAGKKELATLTGHSAAVRAVVCSPDGRTLASGDEDGTVRLWEPVTREELLAFRGETAVIALAFDAGGTVLAAGGKDGRVRLWYAPEEKAGADNR